MKVITTPITDADVQGLKVGDMIYISGYIYTGRDAVLPKIEKDMDAGRLPEMGIDLQGGVIFHTAVSPAGTGPTSSNKLEIEASIAPLSRGGIKLHLGKGKLKAETVAALQEYNAFYAVIPPVTALLESKVSSREVMAYPEEGMEAFHRLYVHEFPCVVAAVHGRSIYD
ncbi:MAG: fumarate hydratase C-terminal domain-containing protein [Oscillospiraceae bacterium]|nr:fumarate hydratase C-terminal domain-containing protein [Oscillospiraceae bacterium]